MSWRIGRAPSLDGPERYVVFKLKTEDGEVEIAVDPPVARQMANALLSEAESAEKEAAMGNDGHGLILPPGVRMAANEPPTVVPCARCGGPITVEAKTYAELRRQAGGSTFALEHENCTPAGETPAEAPRLRAYHIEILIRRDPPEEPRPPQDDDALAWFQVKHEAVSLAMALPALNEKLVPVWEKVQANLDTIDADHEPQP